jgi:hypothetical protein
MGRSLGYSGPSIRTTSSRHASKTQGLSKHSLKYPSIHRQLFNSHDAIIFGKAVSFAFCPFSLLNSSIGEILVFSFPL